MCGNLVGCFGLITCSNLSFGNLGAWLKQDYYTLKKLMAGSQKYVVWADISSFSQGDIFRFQPLVLAGGVRFKLVLFFLSFPVQTHFATRLQQPLRPVSSLGFSSWRVILILTMMTVVMICDDDFNDDGVDPYHYNYN